jgi:coenzyme PQQ synthesis protein D (PqqD)
MTRDLDIDRTRFVVASHVRASTSGDGLVLLDVDGGLVLASNPAGARIWQGIEERRTTAEIARDIAGAYDIPIERARRDAVAFISSLVDRALVTTDPPC